MNTNRILIFLFLLAAMAFTGQAQQTVYHQSLQPDIQQAKELYQSGNYVSAISKFEAIAGQSAPNSDVRAEALFYKALCGLKLDNGNAEEQMTEFMKQFPESVFRNRGLFGLAVYQFDRKKYQAVLKTLEQLSKSELTSDERTYFCYLRGYSEFELDKMDAALSDFGEIKEGNSIYAAPGQYYWGHIQYLKGNNESALQEFLKLKENPVFKKVIPFYISQIYYKQGKYREVVDYTAPLINNVPADQQPELARILGDSYFHLRQFNDAIQFLEFFLSDKKNQGREENYMLGYCYYLGSKEAEAIPHLEIASKGKDELAQNAYYHLAECYVSTNDKNKARQAFEAASDFDFDTKIKEDALFNFAKITYELSYSPFNETIKAFDKYIAMYPNSEHNDAAYDYLVKVYMSTNNYRDAMTSIENIKVKSQSVKMAYQRVAYYRGLECFNNLDYNGAIANFDKSVNAGDFNKSYKALSTFWKAEANYRLGDYNKAISGYTSFLKMSGVFSYPEYQTAHYDLAYAFFQLKDYASAEEYFRKYLNLTSDSRSEKVADACNRLADCNFVNHDYNQAIANYDKALKMASYDADYALFQKSFCQGLLRDNQGKITGLKVLLQNYPKSTFQDDALYELGRTSERTSQPQVAINYYNELLSKFPESSYVNKALVQLGLVYYNANDYQNSIANYKKVIERAPNSPERQAALLGMKNAYVEMNDVDSYLSYTEKLGSGVQVSMNEQDSLTYQSAEKLYMARDSKALAQFDRYLTQFPTGSFALNAHFYKAQLLYNGGESEKALPEFEYVVSQPDNYFTEVALAKAAGLQYDKGNYTQSLTYFERYARVSGNENSLLEARTGIMRCQFQLKNYQASLEAANQVLASGKVSDLLKREGSFVQAISYYNTGSHDKAFPILSKLSAETNSVEGAQSKFLVCDILFEKNKLKEAEKEIMDFIDKNSPHQYWLAKSFILLADIYEKNGDEFEAKHTLKSILENYPDPKDGIMDTTRQKLNQIEANETRQTKNQNKPLEVDITGGKK